MIKNQWVQTPKGLGYVLETKLDKVKIQMTDSSGFTTGCKTDWFEQNEVQEINSPIKTAKQSFNW